MFLHAPLPVAPLMAYLDPGAGSLLLQVLLAGFAAGGVLLKFYWSRLRAMFGLRRSDTDAPPDAPENF